MIISKTPVRISFFGGGTDYPTWVEEHGGAVISATINKYGYITCRQLPPFFEHKHRIVYSKIEVVKTIDEIQHPAVKAVFQFLNVQEGLEVHYDGDIPARSGIGSSSAFTVGLLNALYAFRGQLKSKHDLAKETIHIEQEIIKETVGAQDQVAAAYGGINRIDFLRNGDFEVRPMIIPPQKVSTLNDHMLLFFTGYYRFAEAIAKSKVTNFKNREKQLHRIREMVDEAEKVFYSSSTSLDEIGKLLHEGWKLKRELSDQVSSPQIDQIYETGIQAGALGGKILGAGGGGFIVFYAPPQAHAKIRQALQHLLEVNFRFEFGGSQIALYNPELDRPRTT